MNFSSTRSLHRWIREHSQNFLDSGSQGQCYLVDGKVYKFFWKFIDRGFKDDAEFSRDEILRFSTIENNTYIWPEDVITVGDTVVGYISEYVDSKSLFKINPFKTNLDIFAENIGKSMSDIKIISNSGVLTFDVSYNTMYGDNGFKVIDTMEYASSNLDSSELYRKNLRMFLYEVRMFLIDGCFDKFVEDNKYLYSLCYDDVSFLMFIREFKRMLSEREGYEISTLGDAKNSINFTKVRRYVRELY